MKKLILIILLIAPLSGLAFEEDARVNQKVQEAMKSARQNSTKGPSSTEDWIRVADSAAPY